MSVNFAAGNLALWPAARAFCLLAAVSSLFLTGCSESPGPNAHAAPTLEARQVSVAIVEELPSAETIYATGTLAAFERAELSAKVPGRLQQISVDLGTRVKRGEILAVIEKTEYELRRRQAEAALAQARARLGLSLTGEEDSAKPENTSIAREARAVLEEATKNRERILQLRDQGIIAEAELEAAESNFQVASNRYETALDEARSRLAILTERQVELALASQQLKDTVLTAPFDGVVEQRRASPGEYLQTAAPILTLVRIDPVRLRADVSERDAPRVRPGQKVLLQLEGSGLVRTGEVARLSPVISPQDRMLLVEADFRNPDGILRPGSFAKANIVVDEARRGLFVPSSAVVTFAGIQKIFTVKDGRAFEIEVRTGLSRGEKIEITDGVQAGDTVVLTPGTLRNEQLVEIDRRET